MYYKYIKPKVLVLFSDCFHPNSKLYFFFLFCFTWVMSSGIFVSMFYIFLAHKTVFTLQPKYISTYFVLCLYLCFTSKIVYSYLSLFTSFFCFVLRWGYAGNKKNFIDSCHQKNKNQSVHTQPSEKGNRVRGKNIVFP